MESVKVCRICNEEKPEHEDVEHVFQKLTLKIIKNI